MTCRMKTIRAGEERTIPLSFNIQEWSSVPDLDSISIRFGLDHECSEAFQDQGANLQISKRINFKYSSDVKFSAFSVGERLAYKQEDISFKQVFRIANKGISPTNSKFGFRIYTASSSLVNARVENKEAFNCVAGTVGNIGSTDPYGESGEVISCENYYCNIQECSIKPGFLPSDELTVSISYTFHTTLANRDPDIELYLIRSFISKSSNAPRSEYVPVTTTLLSKTLLAQKGVNPLHYVIGGVVGVVLLVILLIILIKSNVFSKARIFKNKMDDELKMADEK